MPEVCGQAMVRGGLLQAFPNLFCRKAICSLGQKPKVLASHVCFLSFGSSSHDTSPLPRRMNFDSKGFSLVILEMQFDGGVGLEAMVRRCSPPLFKRVRDPAPPCLTPLLQLRPNLLQRPKFRPSNHKHIKVLVRHRQRMIHGANFFHALEFL